MMTVRQAVLKIHLWLSLAFAVVIVIACASGAALVYRHDIDRALNPALYRVTAGDVGWDAVWQTVRAHYPGVEGPLIRGPVDRGVYQVEIGDELMPFTVHVDPGTGRLLGARHPGESLAGWLFLLHFNLFGGEFGHAVVGVTGIALVVLTITGVWLWWPTLRRLTFGFKIRWQRPFFVVNYDVHRVIGIVSLPVVFLVSLTGTMLIFYDVGSRLVHAIFLTTPAAAPATVPTIAAERRGAAARPLTLDQSAALAGRLAPDATASSMYLPRSPSDPLKVWLRTPGDIRPNVGSWHARIDRTTGEVVSAMIPSNTTVAAHVDETWVITLHYGTFGGEWLRALYVVGGLVPVVLLITGTAHWLLRSRSAHADTLKTIEL